MSLNSIVTVSITRATSTPTRVGFGIPLVTAYTTVFPERYRLYSSTTAMATDGFATTDPAYRMANKIFSQTPSPSQIAVGRTENDEVMTIDITPSSTDLRATTAYTVYLNGSARTYTTDATPTVSEITAGLTAAITPAAWVTTTGYTVGEYVTNDTGPVKVYVCTTAGTSGATGPTGTSSGITDGTCVWNYVSQDYDVTATDGTTKVTVAADTVADIFSLYVNIPAVMDLADVTADGSPGIAADLTAIRAQYDDWYMMLPTNQGAAVLTAAAAAIEGYTAPKALLSSTPDSACLDSTSTTDIMAVTNTAAYDRTMLKYHPKSNVDFPAAGWAGRCLPTDPGTITWAYKSLSGIDFTVLNDTEKAAIEGKEGNYYVKISGISNTYWGTCASGEFMDIIRGTDALQARIQEYVYAALSNSDKIPFTDVGASRIQVRIEQALAEFTVTPADEERLLTNNPAPTVTVPKVATVSATNKGNRILPDITFNAFYAGAIHKVQIQGTISL